VSAQGVGFDHDTNEVTILGSDGATTVVPLGSKRQVADAVLDAVVARLGGDAAPQKATADTETGETGERR
jgi:phosphopantothenoylcysteine decarboxylase / phosphopantothenate---cysteine ligase